MVLSASGTAALAGSGPAAAAYDYLYCIESAKTGGFPNNRCYRSYAQCMASASGWAA
jgi:hypothetical protein